MQIDQLQVAVDPIQDRLLLRISTSSQEEVRVFFTRRFLRELWPALTGMLLGHLGARQSQPVVGNSPAGPATGDKLSPANFEQPYKNENPSFPLGSNPLLTAEATMEPAGEGLCKLTLRELKERSFTLNLNTEMLQALCSMLRAAAEQAQWNLSLNYGVQPAQSAPADKTSAPKTRLH